MDISSIFSNLNNVNTPSLVRESISSSRKSAGYSPGTGPECMIMNSNGCCPLVSFSEDIFANSNTDHLSIYPLLYFGSFVIYPIISELVSSNGHVVASNICFSTQRING